MTSTKHFLQKLPFKVQLRKDARFLHPEAKNEADSLSSISRLTMIIAKVVSGVLHRFFSGASTCTVDSLCEMVRTHWQFYQAESIPEEFFLQHEDPNAKSSIKQTSHWEYALKTCGLSLTLENDSMVKKYKRNDHYWASVASIVDDQGRAKFSQLCALGKCIFCISHVNSTPERGFSLNKNLLSIHGRSIHKDTLVALRIVKDSTLQVGGMLNFPISNSLITSAENTHSKYFADLQAKREAKITVEKEKQQALNEVAATVKESAQKEICKHQERDHNKEMYYCGRRDNTRCQ